MQTRETLDSKIDELGKAVRKECYLLKVILQQSSVPPKGWSKLTSHVLVTTIESNRA
jgi:hypothetical protein